jgi:hypothetical protein
MIDSVSTLQGGALSSKIYAYSRHGDGSTHSLARRVMNRICKPFYRYDDDYDDDYDDYDV